MPTWPGIPAGYAEPLVDTDTWLFPDNTMDALEAIFGGSQQIGVTRSQVVPNTASDNTGQVQDELDALHAAGGGRLLLPGGRVNVSGLEMRHRVSIQGAGMRRTKLKPVSGAGDDGVIMLNQGYAQDAWLEDLEIEGNGNSGQHGLAMVATPIAPDDNGGWWQSGMRRVEIKGFAGDCIRLAGGPAIASDYLLPHQFLVFDSVYAFASATGHALYQSGQVGQVNFLGGQLDGPNTSGAHPAIRLETDGYAINFYGTTIQSAHTGAEIDGASPVLFSGCWFESLGNGVVAINSTVVIDGGKAANVGADGSGTGGIVKASGTSEVSVTNQVVQGSYDRKYVNDGDSSILIDGQHQKHFAFANTSYNTLWTLDVPDYDGGLLELNIGGVVSSVGMMTLHTEKLFGIDTGSVSVDTGTTVVKGQTFNIQYDASTTPGKVYIQVQAASGTGLVGESVISVHGSRAKVY